MVCVKFTSRQGKSPPFRPILSAIGTTTYKVAKFFVPILEEHTKNEYTLKDSFQFAEDIGNQDASLFMTSFDVESLFTNIPLDETINLCVTKMYKNKRKVHGLTKSKFRELLDISTKQSLFIFNNTFYTQIDGVAMGSPLGPTLANIFLSHFENIWLEECPLQFKPVYYKRYVDDIFLLFRSHDHVNKFQIFLNSRHRCMKFSLEVENDNQLPFLDVKVCRKEGRFVTSLYRKRTFSGVYLNYKSFVPTE